MPYNASKCLKRFGTAEFSSTEQKWKHRVPAKTGQLPGKKMICNGWNIFLSNQKSKNIFVKFFPWFWSTFKIKNVGSMPSLGPPWKIAPPKPKTSAPTNVNGIFFGSLPTKRWFGVLRVQRYPFLILFYPPSPNPDWKITKKTQFQTQK